MNERDIRRLNAAVAKNLGAMRPPENITVSEWAEKYRRLPPSSAEPGMWRTRRTPYLREPMNAFTDPKVRRIVMVASSQVGKALDVDTPIPTPDGWTRMGDLVPGDTVFDENGTPCRVTAATGIMLGRPCYKLTFSDGAEIVADAEHLWVVDEWTITGAEYRKTLTTAEMSRAFKIGNRNVFAIPVAGALRCEPAELPIPPYTLGVWLGDGNSCSAQITMHEDDAEIISYIKQEGVCTVRREIRAGILNVQLEPKPALAKRRYCIRGHDMNIAGRNKKGGCAECSRQHSKHSQYGFVMEPAFPQRSTGHSLLRNLDLLKNKHIPGVYLRASYEQRLSLLQGLMDSDGHITKNGRCEITLKDKTLAYDTAELILTLGIKCTVKEKRAVCTNSQRRAESTVYRISFLAYDDTPVFRLLRKLDRMVSRNSVGQMGKPRRTTETDRRRVVDIVRMESRPVKCIQVGNENHMYLAGRSMIPTHNSEFELNCIGYVIHQDPGNILYIHPDIDDAKKFSQLRVAPMISESAVLNSRVAKSKSRDSSNTMLKKSFPGGMLIMCGSNVAADLASTPARYIFGDERDRWATSAGNEGDPWKLATARQITFYNSKAVEVSTPTIKNASAIDASFSEGTMERWCVECPHCGSFHDIKRTDIRFEHDEKIVRDKKQFTITNIRYICPGCGCISSEQEIKKQPAKWIAGNPDAYERGVRSFWLNSFVSPWASWESTFLEFLYAGKNSKKQQVVYNTRFGELWEDRGDLEDEDSLMQRREEYPAELPEGVLVLTCGVDTQDDRLEYEVVGWGHFGESWGIEKGVILGRPDDNETWQRLDDVIDRVYRFEDGLGLKASLTFVDEGGHFTQDVRQQCRARIGKQVFAIAGSNRHDAPFTSPPRKQKIIVSKRIVGSCYRYDIGVDAGKQIITDNLRVQTPGSKYCHFPKRDDYGSAYFKGLLSEHLVYKPERKQPWIWEKIPGHERNEALDCRNYALAAYKALPADLDAIDRRLKIARKELPSAPVATASTPKAQKRRAQRKGSALSKYYEEW